MKRTCTIMTSLLLFVLLMTSAWAERPIGYIENIGGPASAFELYRNGKKKNVAIMMALYAGDQLTKIKTKQCKEGDTCTITLKLGEHHSVQVDNSKCPYTIEPVGEPPSLPAKLMKKVASWFKPTHKVHRATLLTKAIGPDDDLKMPLFTKYKARLTAGERTLYLGWNYGKAPYHVRVYQDGMETLLLEQQNIQDIRLRQENLTLKEGMYLVEISDAEGAQVTGQFQVVPKDKLPALPEEFKQSTLEAPLKDTLFAVWLLDEHQDWEFEVYQLVAPIAENYYPALLVREQLELE